MNLILLFLIALQVPQTPIEERIIVNRLLPNDMEYIITNEEIRTKIYITAILEDGRKLSVPVVNGLLPVLHLSKLPNGGMKRQYVYSKKIKHDGSKVVNYVDVPKEEIKKAEKLEIIEMPPLPKLEILDFDELDIEKTTLEENQSLMRRPSELSQ